MVQINKHIQINKIEKKKNLQGMIVNHKVDQFGIRAYEDSAHHKPKFCILKIVIT